MFNNKYIRYIKINKKSLLITLLLTITCGITLYFLVQKWDRVVVRENVVKISKKQKNLYLLDAGHGATSHRNGNNYVQSGDTLFWEYAYVFEIRDILSEMLNASNIYNVYVDSFTHKRNLGINERVDLINTYYKVMKEVHKADHSLLVVSLHANHSRNIEATGIEVLTNINKADKYFENPDFFKNEMISVSELLADKIALYSGLPLRKKSGKKYKLTDRVGILKRTRCYAVLSENGFFSNPDERALMSTKQFKTKIAYAHYVVICQIEEIKPIPIELWM